MIRKKKEIADSSNPDPLEISKWLRTRLKDPQLHRGSRGMVLQELSKLLTEFNFRMSKMSFNLPGNQKSETSKHEISHEEAPFESSLSEDHVLPKFQTK